MLQMIKCRVLFVAVNIFHLTLFIKTMEIHTTDPAILSESATTANQKAYSVFTSYEEYSTTTKSLNISDTFTYMDRVPHIKLNTTSDSFISGFDISNYQNNCTEFYEYKNVNKLQYISYDGEFIQQLIETSLELHEEFHVLIKNAMNFACTGNVTARQDVITTSETYVQKCMQFVARLLDLNTTELEDLNILDPKLYEASIQHIRSVMKIIDLFSGITAQQAEIDSLNLTIVQNIEEMYFFNKTTVLEDAVREENKLVSLLKNYIEKTVNLSKCIEENNFLDILITNHTSQLLDIDYWKIILEQEHQLLQNYEERLLDSKYNEFVLYKVKPVVMVIVLVVGIPGNWLLLTIFIRYKEMRTLPNSMLINLTIVDFVSLVLNLLLEYLRLVTYWRFGLLGCKLFYTSRYVFIGVSTYSVVMISFQRFMAVRMSSRASCHLGKKTKYVSIATVWVLSFILSVPHALVANVKEELCLELSLEYFGPVSTSDLVVFCAVPLLLVTMFSGMTANRIRRSVHNIPGEGTGQEQMRHNRMVSSNILIALVVLFVISYTPDFLYKFLIFQIQIQTSIHKFYMINTITYYLRFVNCCLNPLVLFLMSKKYRNYMKEYLYCGKNKKALHSNQSEDTIESSL